MKRRLRYIIWMMRLSKPRKMTLGEALQDGQKQRLMEVKIPSVWTLIAHAAIDGAFYIFDKLKKQGVI
jgi:hypothetical protein